ncbi:hypothetical protein M409DRAFT_23354 [Zasmidium cellare ATCC 36951]|uniref:Uncharacterized protein n=1 Tax=Zasmidium cellare ATCC 36951 TaxID=1080233 RepID=A0A6A6CHR5_ZASCE|nr:uncharacterized protein M409DRAFT_23354 [Zasmidium cellare ATCC 36951]KAF2166163.1 hypothetical protein M409DRAFT_23354 [Zasmidium cellare ATCC 36951]
MVSTRLFTLGAVVASVCVAVANPSPSIEHIKKLLARQDDDSDDRQCHADCGFTIIQSSETTPNTYCSNQTWIDQLNRCLSCTNREDDDDIWEDYGNSVSSAAQACSGQTATPGAVLSTASATGTATGGSLTSITGTATSTGAATAPTSVEECHTHGDDLFCVADGAEWEVTSNVNVNNAPDNYENCRPTGDDGDDLTCVAADGSEVRLEREGDDHTDDDDHNHGSSTATGTPTSNPSPSITSAVAGEASNTATTQTATQDGAAGRFEGSSIGGVFGLVLAMFAL